VSARAALRSSEWLQVGFFGYVAVISFWFPRQPLSPAPPLVLAFVVPALLAALAYGEAKVHPQFFSIARDWVPLGLTLVAYREMDWFSPLVRDHHLEHRWISWDRWLLYDGGLQRGIEALGSIGPAYFEFCYLLVYAVGPFAVAVLYFAHRRERVNQVVFLYLLGTLLAYALFPLFPSDPPRTVFAGADLPGTVTALRRFNLWIVGGYGIHSSVFPSAHVSSAFSAGFALLLFLPERKLFGWGMMIYAVSVAIATVYGRYHYAVDAITGLAVSLIATGLVAFTSFLSRRRLLLRGLP
jgi:membrane-associated phospholipid phosphatase